MQEPEVQQGPDAELPDPYPNGVQEQATAAPPQQGPEVSPPDPYPGQPAADTPPNAPAWPVAPSPPQMSRNPAVRLEPPEDPYAGFLGRSPVGQPGEAGGGNELILAGIGRLLDGQARILEMLKGGARF